MDDSLQWLLLNGDKISALALLLIFVLALIRQWIVLGFTHQECVRDRDGFKARVDALAKSNEEELTRLRREVEELRSDYHAHRGRTR